MDRDRSRRRCFNLTTFDAFLRAFMQSVLSGYCRDLHRLHHGTDLRKSGLEKEGDKDDDGNQSIDGEDPLKSEMIYDRTHTYQPEYDAYDAVELTYVLFFCHMDILRK